MIHETKNFAFIWRGVCKKQQPFLAEKLQNLKALMPAAHPIILWFSFARR
jgi:hypothetical protein